MLYYNQSNLQDNSLNNNNQMRIKLIIKKMIYEMFQNGREKYKNKLIGLIKANYQHLINLFNLDLLVKILKIYEK